MPLYGQKFYDTFRPILDKTLALFWNNQWAETTVLHNVRGKGMVDVRDFINGDTDEQVLEMQEIANQFISLSNDEKAFALLKWVHWWVTYKRDPLRKKMPEYWQNAYETFKDKEGDCEDGAILLLKLCRLAGIPAFRIKLVGGDVESPTDVDKDVGHCYCIYLSEKYNRWFTLDWCYWYESCMNDYELLAHSDRTKYHAIWWTLNDERAWAQYHLMVAINGDIVKL